MIEAESQVTLFASSTNNQLTYFIQSQPESVHHVREAKVPVQARNHHEFWKFIQVAHVTFIIR
jgi:hypothetical protein